MSQRNLFGDIDPPSQRHSDTSRAAAKEIKGKAAALRRQVYQWLLSYEGATDEEMQMHIPMEPNTQRPRRVELVNMGLVFDSGYRRKTRSGRYAVIWMAIEKPQHPSTSAG